MRRYRGLPDRRAVRLELTEAGAAKAAEAQPYLEEVLVRCVADLEADEVRALVVLLKRLTPVDETGDVAP